MSLNALAVDATCHVIRVALESGANIKQVGAAGLGAQSTDPNHKQAREAAGMGTYGTYPQSASTHGKRLAWDPGQVPSGTIAYRPPRARSRHRYRVGGTGLQMVRCVVSTAPWMHE